MNVVVCVKQIPDPATPGKLDPETKTLKREGKLILDDSDAYGVEMALQLADKAGGGDVTLVSMAPNDEVYRRVHRHDSGPGRRAARMAVVDVREARGGRGRQGHDRAPDRGGLRQ